MRLFIAIDINSDMKDELSYLGSIIKANSDRCSITHTDNMHLTLAFIGEYDDPEKITEALNGIDINKFSLTFSDLGYFDRKNEKLIYAALEKNNSLTALQREITSRLKTAGITFDNKKFLPHITIARRVIGMSKEDFSRIKINKISCTVSGFYLYSSDLSGKRPVYTKIATFNLK